MIGADQRSQKLAFVLIPRFNMMSLTTTVEPLRIANYFSGQSLYEWCYLSVGGESVTASNGMSLATQGLDFDPARMRRLFDAGRQIGSQGSQAWLDAPPRLGRYERVASR